MKTTAKDFFLHLGTIVALYTTVISFLNLVFSIINKAYPEVTSYYSYSYGGSDLSLPVATLIIFFPIFIFLSYLVHNTYIVDPLKKDLPIRKWLTYITLFIAGLILAGDFVTVLYKFLDGQDLTLGFLLKALSVLVVAGIVFGYYINDIRDKIQPTNYRIWAIATSVVILVFIIIGFSVLGSPKTQRLYRYDAQKLTDLQNIESQIINTWQNSGFIPETINSFVDSQNNKTYEYRKTGELNFELCADFNFAYQENPNIKSYPVYGLDINKKDSWSHDAGRQCFQREIDINIYPTRIKG